MPSHPQAKFVPLSPDFDLDELVKTTPNFFFVERVSAEDVRRHSAQNFEDLVLQKVVKTGKPLIVEDWGPYLPPWLFSKDWLEENLGKEAYNVRDIPNEVNIPMTMGHYLRSMNQLAKQFKPSDYKDPKRQRLYLKDIDCPEPWAEHLRSQVIPEEIHYLNECIESRTGGDGSIREPNEYGQMVYGKGVAPAGDLMSSLPPAMRAENMMCYIGHEGTYTAAHREMCGTLGHNIMVEASSGSNGEKPGSSIWFMTETKDRGMVSEYFLSTLGHDIEVEKHFAQLNAWKKAPFNVLVVEQKSGDLLLIPPLAPHQVWNRGTRTMKVAWNRTTVDTLELALHEALPRARMVCREEQYKCKATIYFTLVKYHALLQRDTVEPKMWKYGRIKQLLDDFKRLFYLYQEILVSEMFSLRLSEEENVEFIPYDSFVTCSYCRGNIFNRFLTCKSCIQHGEVKGEPVEDTYDVCMDCYAMGRSCACISNLTWVEQWEWSTLVQNYEQWRNVVIQADGYFDAQRSPPALDLARKSFGRKPIAEVCQEQLKIRPFKDPNRERTPTPEMSDVEPEVDDEGRPKPQKGGKKPGISMPRKGRVVPTEGKTHTCHICMHHEWNWKLAFCTTCNLAYCYGTLWRAFDMSPQSVMEDKEWQCPRCEKKCSCGKCRKPPSKQIPYQPKGTLLGHDTKKVADFRSVESLVDFSRTNQSWLRDEDANNPQQSARMQRLKEKAEADKARTNEKLSAENGEDDPFEDNLGQRRQDIDPTLLSLGPEDDNDRFYRDSYAAAQHVADSYAVGNPNEFSNGWADAHYDLDDYEINDQHQAGYPSRLLAPVAPMLGPEHMSYPDPSSLGQSRMIVNGQFHQNGAADRILYEAPVRDDAFEQVSQPLTPSKNPNMLFSDLLAPNLEQAPQSKKRKKIGPDGEDPEDVEFFASKRQKLYAKTKKHRQEHQSEDVDSISRPEKRMPRRSTGKPQSYQDLGEAAVPIEEDEGPSRVSSHRKHSVEHNNSDLELAAKALSRLSNPKPKEKKAAPPKKRRSMRDLSLASTGSQAASPNVIKTPRKSAWLLRKEAEDAGKDFPSELPKKRSRKRHSNTFGSDHNTAFAEISSAVEDDDDGDGVERDSLFGEPIEPELNIEQETTTPPPSNSVQVGEEASQVKTEPSTAAEKHGKSAQTDPVIAAASATTAPAPKRRGRPPKGRPSLASIPMRSESPMQSEVTGSAKPASAPSPAPSRAPAAAMLSLKEKLALKGKKFKIVAAKSRSIPGPSTTYNRALSNTPSTIGSGSGKTPSVIITTPAVKPPVAQSAGWKSINGTSQAMKLTLGILSAGSPSVKNPTMHSSITTEDASALPSQQQRKGPTVVRLASPESSASDPSSSDDESIHNERRSTHIVSHSSLSMQGRPPGMTARRGRSTRGHQLESTLR